MLLLLLMLAVCTVCAVCVDHTTAPLQHVPAYTTRLPSCWHQSQNASPLPEVFDDQRVAPSLPTTLSSPCIVSSSLEPLLFVLLAHSTDADADAVLL